MTLFRLNASLSGSTLPVRTSRSVGLAAMLSRAVSFYSGSHNNPPKQKPLQPNLAVLNASKPIESNKRKFDRTMSSLSTSSLGQLHSSAVFFTENDFEDDATIDLTGSPPTKKLKDAEYPLLGQTVSTVNYPTLPSAPAATQAPQSNTPVPWSSSPPTHFEPPKPSKRRTVPWLDKDDNDKTAFAPLPQNKPDGDRYPWNKTASAVKAEQAEFKRKNKQRPIQKPELSTKSVIKSSKPLLSEEQRQILEIVCDEGKSVFFTGSAGTGKSVLMRSIISELRRKFQREPDRLAVTASTGLASCNIEGITLHSFAGIGLGKEPAPELIKKIKRNPKNKTRWLRTKVLIIDEISMVDAELFDKLEQIARVLRNNGRPFGGIQLVVTGDFFQLPPVPEKDRQSKFAFDAATWNTTIKHTILLTHIFRQKDPVFAGMLNEMRLGKLSPESIRAFQRLSRPLTFRDEVDATELFPTRGEVDRANSERMKKLSGETFTFPAVDSGIADLNVRNKILSNFMAPETLTLKKGAQVMLIKNIDNQLVNGALGKVTSFMDEATFKFYTENEETYMRAQLPAGEDEDEENAKAREKLRAARYKSGTVPTKLWPHVRFTLPDNTCRTLLCQPEEWKTEAPGGEIIAKRMQVPLILAWALSIHKAQGQTLERVKVDMGRVFEKGQAYVALSRATNQEGLQVTRFDQKKVMVHPRVVEFYKKLVSVESMKGPGDGTAKTKAGTSAPHNQQEIVDLEDDEEEEELRYMYGS